MAEDLSDYLLDNYGLCKLGNDCICIKPIKPTSPLEFRPWLGRLCPNWQPAGATTLEELQEVEKVFK